MTTYTAVTPVIDREQVCSTVRPVLRCGDQGPEVNALRQLLAQSDRGFGIAGLAVGDMFTATIESIIKQFQYQVFLSQDGIVGPQTWRALCADAPVHMPTICRGVVGEAVRQAQSRLLALAFYTGDIDGDFGEKTHHAVVKFQRDQGLAADGIVGPISWDRLGRL